MNLNKFLIGSLVALSVSPIAQAGSLPNCNTYNSGPTYYEDHNLIKIPTVYKSSEPGVQYCAILQDLNSDGKYEITTFILKSYHAWVPVYFDENAGTARLDPFMWIANGGSTVTSGSATLVQDSDGQFQVTDLDI